MHSSGPVVVGVDFSPASEQALDVAIETAKRWHTGVELVHAVTALGAPGLDLERPPTDAVRNESADITASGPRTPQSWLARARRRGVAAHLVTRSGPAATVILEEAARLNARAIVVGSHGSKGLERAILGSVAEAVRQRSPIPVMVVPGKSAAA